MIYKELIDIGFKRHDSVDHVHFDQTGNNYFYLTYKFRKNIAAEWDNKTGDVIIFREYSGGDFSKVKVTDKETLVGLIKIFSK